MATKSGNKTVANSQSVASFLKSVEHPQRRADAQALLKIFKAATGERPKMWGSSIVGFGQYHYRYDSGREGDFMKTGFSPRKQNLVLYVMPGFEASKALREKLGKYRIGKSCLYINKLADVDLPTLEKLVAQGYKIMCKRYDCKKT